MGQGSELVLKPLLMVVCAVQSTEEMLELASDKRDEAMTAMADGNVVLLLWHNMLLSLCSLLLV